jgi:hypothetical protein
MPAPSPMNYCAGLRRAFTITAARGPRHRPEAVESEAATATSGGPGRQLERRRGRRQPL